VRSARLLGHQHHALEAVAAVAEGPVAITLCRGGARKTYYHTDPNEDAACFAFGAFGILVAVADGHHGARGAELAVEWLLANRAPEWTGSGGPADPDAWQESARETLQAIHREVLSQGESLRVEPAPTTLSLALVRPEAGLLLHASVGDSHVFLARQNDPKGHEARDLAWSTTGRRRCAFLGERYEGEGLREEHWVVGCEPLDEARAVLLATDGLSEVQIGVEDPAAAAAGAVEHALDSKPSLRALEACRKLTETALDAHRRNAAGDNMSAAVIWLDSGDE
jgi:serine/threonine protein phosphatase PrpC